MIALLYFVLNVLVSPFKSKSRLEAENAALRHQVAILRRIVHRRVDSTGVVRDIDIESGMHHLVGVVRRRIPDYGNVVAEFGGKAHSRFNAGMCNESNHNE